jgi:hypothetical protein
MAAVAEVDVDPGKDESSRCLGAVDLGTVDLRLPEHVDDRPAARWVRCHRQHDLRHQQLILQLRIE